MNEEDIKALFDNAKPEEITQHSQPENNEAEMTQEDMAAMFGNTPPTPQPRQEQHAKRATPEELANMEKNKADIGLFGIDYNALGRTADIVGDSLAYNFGKARSGINALGANVSDFVGLDSLANEYRQGQAKAQDYTKTQEDLIKEKAGDGLLAEAAKEIGNPLNYIAAGKGYKLGKAALTKIAAIVGVDTANEIAAKGDMSGVDIDDAQKVAINAALGVTASKGLEYAGNGIKNFFTKNTDNLDRLSPRNKSDLMEEHGYDEMTSMIYPPKTYPGKLVTSAGRKIPGSTSGKMAKVNDKTRENITELVEEFGDDKITNTLKNEVMDNIYRTRTKRRDLLGKDKDKIFKKLDKKPINAYNTNKIIDSEIIRLKNELEIGNEGIIEVLENYKINFNSNKDPMNFDRIKSRLGKELKGNPDKYDQEVAMAVKNKLYAAVKDDIGNTIRLKSGDKEVLKWENMNESFKNFYAEAEKASIKNLMKNGKVDFETVDKLLNSSNVAELNFLRKNLDEKGLQSAKGAILKKLMDKALGAGDELATIHTTKFRKGMADIQPQIDAIFTKTEQVRLKNFQEVLNIVKEAETANVVPRTGEQVASLYSLAGVATAGAVSSGMSGAVMALGGVGALARIMDSKTIAKKLIKIGEVSDSLKIPLARSIMQDISNQMIKQSKNPGVINPIVQSVNREEQN